MVRVRLRNQSWNHISHPSPRLICLEVTGAILIGSASGFYTKAGSADFNEAANSNTGANSNSITGANSNTGADSNARVSSTVESAPIPALWVSFKLRFRFHKKLESHHPYTHYGV